MSSCNAHHLGIARDGPLCTDVVTKGQAREATFWVGRPGMARGWGGGARPASLSLPCVALA